MKKIFNFRLLAVMLFALCALMCTVSSCNEHDDPIVPSEELGTSSFEVINPNGSGDGSSSPAVVETGDTLSMVIKQKSSYKDVDGSVFTCEPKATIELFSSEEVVYVEDIKSLTDVKGSASVSTEKVGTNPVTNKIKQTFTIGGKSIEFDLNYEVYKYNSKAGQTIEMPYVKINTANLGQSEAVQTRNSDGYSTPAISLKAINLTRGPVVRDTTEYEVTARFNLTIESVNTNSNAPQSLDFEVKYVSMVTTATELPDPFGEIEYVIEGAEKPYTVSKTNPLNLSLKQTSSYTDSYGQVYNKSLVGTISAEASLETDSIVCGDSSDAPNLTSLKAVSKMIEKQEMSSHQQFVLGNQKIDFKINYQKAYTEDYFEMPYMKIDTVKFNKIVSANEISSNTQNEKKYQIKALFDVDLESENAKTSKKETVQIYVTYVMRVIVREPQIVKVVYRPGYQWFEPHDNITLSYIFIVYRDCYYDNGKVETSTFNNYVPYAPSFVGCYAFLLFPQEWLNEHNIEYQCYSVHQEWNGGTFDPYTSLGVKDLSLLDVRPMEFNANDEYYLSCGDCYEYRKSHFEKLYHKDQFTNYDESVICHASESAFEQNFPKTNLPTGWYLCEWASKPLAVATLFYEDYSILQLGTRANISHLALVMDGRVIMFDEWVPKFKEAITSTPYTGHFSKGTNVRIEKRSTELQFLGRDFYVERVDTLYQTLPK